MSRHEILDLARWSHLQVVSADEMGRKIRFCGDRAAMAIHLASSIHERHVDDNHSDPPIQESEDIKKLAPF